MKRLDGPDWDAEALHDIGAISIFDLRDDDGRLVGFEVFPDDVDVVGYDAALTARKLRRLRAYAAAKRYDVETGGIVVAGIPVATDRNSQHLISGAFALSSADNTLPIRFKGADGAFRTLGSGGIQVIALAVAGHVQACFAAEASVLSSIEAGDITSAVQIDVAFAEIGT